MKTEEIVGEHAIEGWKGMLDYFKHITTVCSAASLVCIALYEKIVVKEFQVFLIVSIGLFIGASAAAILTHLAFLIPNFKGCNTIEVRKNAGLGLFLTIGLAFCAFACLGLYVLLALYQKS